MKAKILDKTTFICFMAIEELLTCSCINISYPLNSPHLGGILLALSSMGQINRAHVSFNEMYTDVDIILPREFGESREIFADYKG